MNVLHQQYERMIVATRHGKEAKKLEETISCGVEITT
jgi:hypothetical protein